MSSPPSLRDLQEWMRWIITDPRGVAEALSDPAPAAPRLRSCLAWISETPGLCRQERLDIYAEGYFSRIAESMSADFRAVRRLVGETAFLKLVADHLKAHPSIYPNIGEVGTLFPAFLSEHELTREVPCLPELARLEWLVIESFYADDSFPLDLSSLRGIPENSWLSAVLGLDPSVRLMRTRWPVHELWRKGDPEAFDAAWERFEPRPAYLCLHRARGEVRVRELGGMEFRALSLMAQGAPLEKLCIELEEALEAQQWAQGELRLMEWFGDWVRRGLISRIDFDGSLR